MRQIFKASFPINLPSFADTIISDTKSNSNEEEADDVGCSVGNRERREIGAHERSEDGARFVNAFHNVL